MKSSRKHFTCRKLALGWRFAATFLLPIQIITTVPSYTWAAGSTDINQGAATSIATPSATPRAIPPPEKVAVNRTVPSVTAPASTVVFSDTPADVEFLNVHVFSEPLIPIGGKTSAEENKALAQALVSFSQADNSESTGPLTDFLTQYPNTPWKASLLTNLGIVYRRTGYWSKAMDAWEQAWKLSKSAEDITASRVADRAVGEFAELNSRLGRFDRLQKLFTEIGNRSVHGPGAVKIEMAKQGVWLMQNRPEKAFRCGPMALGRILAAQNSTAPLSDKIFNAKSTLQGMSLDQVNALANDLGMQYQMAKRDPGAEVITPAVVNWKVGHYAAIVKEQAGRYLIQDPTFTDDIRVSQQALDAEGSGYYLVPQGALPPGWHTVGADEAKTVWGKGNVGSWSLYDSLFYCPKCHLCEFLANLENGTPMTSYDVDPSRINLLLYDTPVRYTPPVGPAVKFTVSYAQMETAPVSSPTYSNLGPQWSCNWLAYIVDDPANTATSSYGPSGGTLTYGTYSGSSTSGTFAMQQVSHGVLIRTGTASYEQDFPDGSKQIYGLSDGATPKKIFMTASIDPSGKQLTFGYDAHFRLTSVTDAIGQVTTLSYVSNTVGNSGFYLVSQVTDPFSRSASFTYNGSGQLSSITDILGITSSFTYGSGDFVNALTTPYGTTNFVQGGSGINLTLKITDPRGGVEFLQYDDGDAVYDSGSATPSGINTQMSLSQYRNTYYWDKEAYLQGAGDKTKAKIMHWLHTSYDVNVASDILESEKPALESRIFYNYPGQTTAYTASNSNQPSKVGRVLDSGTTQLYQYDYNALGKVTKVVDPLGRTTTYKYDTNNVDLLAVYQENASGASTDTYSQHADLIMSGSYNSYHQPLTVTDAAGQTTTFTYSTSGTYTTGLLLTVTNAKSETTTFAYDTYGYLQSVTGPVTGATTSFTYDGYGRVYTVTDSEGYVVTENYDAADRPTTTTYPDGTTQQITYNKLDAEWVQDRLGRKTHIFHDALRHTVAVQDPLLRVTQYEWCNCGAMTGLIDPAGNRTTWDRDVEGRVIAKTFNDGTAIYSTYENNTSRLKASTDIIGQVTNYAYNVDDTLASVSYSNAQNSTPSVSYTYDSVYNRVASMVDVTGTTAYGYNTITGTATLGAGRLASVTGPLASSAITYGYDELGSVLNHSINGSANTESVTYDSLGRISKVVNPLASGTTSSSGTFNYSYVNQTARLSGVSYPNGQSVNYAYYGNTGDQQLQTIANLDTTSGTMSQFDYTYNAAGQITSWQQNNSALAAAKTYAINYDDADQLTGAALIVSGSNTANYTYGYDKAGNRTQEQIDSTTTTSAYNGLNQLIGQSAGGLTHFKGGLSEWASVTVGGNAAKVNSVVTMSGTSYNFDGAVSLGTGTNTVSVVATDASSNSGTNNYQVVVPSGTAKAVTYDLMGNMVNDGTNNYVWDAENRLIKIWYGTSGSSASTTFVYDGMSRRSQTVEKDAGGTVTSTKNFVWDGTRIVEERNTSNTVTKRFYSQGEQISGTSYYYVKDHLGSIREMTDAAGTIQARYDYDLWGRLTKVSGSMDADFAYTGHYWHQPSRLYLAPFREYSANLARWMNRDPIAEEGGINLYGYALNSPTIYVDLFGLDVWIEGPTGDEPSGHQKIAVGDPNGVYNAYSFGASGVSLGMGLVGTVYEDEELGGAINPKYYLKTSPHVDSVINQMLGNMVGQKYPYRLANNNCRTFSQDVFNVIKDGLIQMDAATLATPPSRVITPQTPWYKRLWKRLSSTSSN